MKEEKKMLGGWRVAAIVGGVLTLLLGAAEALLMQRWDLAGDCVAGSLGLFLLSSVLKWMGEIESHLRSIRSSMATGTDRLVRMERIMDAGAKAGTESGAEAVRPSVKESQPGVYNAQAEADIYRRSQSKPEGAWSEYETVPEKPGKMEMDDAIRMARKLTR